MNIFVLEDTRGNCFVYRDMIEQQIREHMSIGHLMFNEKKLAASLKEVTRLPDETIFRITKARP